MRRIKVFIILLCFCVSLTACRSGNTTSESNENFESETGVESIVSIPESVIDEEPIFSPPQMAVVPIGINTGKKIAVTGLLKNSEYSQKLLELEGILNSHNYNISLSVYSVDGTKGLEYNTDAQIFGACTVKAAYTLYACKQMELGNGNLQTQMTYQEKHYESGTGDMQYSPYGTVFSMETALSKSMSISDNVGYLMSVDFFGREGYNDWVSTLGCDSLKIKPTVWSLRTKSNDLVRVWCNIYNYFETDTTYSKFLYDTCTNTAGNYATAALEGVDYSHKQGHNSTGDWLSYSDAGIVWKGDSPYIIAILTDAPGPNSYSSGEFAHIIDIVHNDLF